jgi:hypothetical protein
MKGADFVIFECLTALAMAHALLSTMGTSMQTQVLFYSVLLIMNLICLLSIYLLLHPQVFFMEFLESLSRESFTYVTLGFLAVFVTAAMLSRQFIPGSAIHVPFVTSLTTLPELASSVLWNFGLIANSEETTKLVGHNALYIFLMDHMPENKRVVEATAALFPIGFWAILHAYVAYVGPYLFPLVIVAFISGLLIFLVLWKTKSLIAAITVHGLYNVVVVTISGMGWMQVQSIYPIGISILTFFNLLLLTLSLLKKRRFN